MARVLYYLNQTKKNPSDSKVIGALYKRRMKGRYFMNTKNFFKALSFGLIMAVAASSCGKKKKGGGVDNGVGPAPAAVPVNNYPSSPYGWGSGNDPYANQIANTYQSAYGSIVFVSPIQCGNGNTVQGQLTWAQFYSSCVIAMAQPYGSYWGNFNYGSFYNQNQYTFQAWQQTAVYVTGGYATGGRSMNVSLFDVFNTFVSSGYNSYNYYMPYYYGGYYPVYGQWPYSNSNYCGNVYYGSNSGWSVGFNLSGFWN